MSNSSNSGMTHAEMLSEFNIENGQITTSTLTISPGQFTASIDSLLGYCYGGQTITIDSPNLVADNGESGGVEISGTSDCLGMPNLSVTLYAKIEDGDQIKMDLSYALIGTNPDPVFWKLSKSVPGVERPNLEEPATFDRNTGTLTQPTHRPLDDLKFYETSFWVTNRDSHTHPVTGVDLEWGINFVSMVIPEGPLAMVKNLLGYTSDLKVSGTIRKPRVADTTDILTLPYGGGANGGYHPWDTKDDFEFGLPGAHLKIHLGINYSIVSGEVEFAAEYLNIYEPYNASWAVNSTQPTFTGQQAYSGAVTLPNAGISMDFNVPFDFGVNYLSFNSKFEGMSLANLSDLVGLAGQGENLMSHMPAELQNLSEGLGALSLEKAWIDLDFRNLSQIHIANIGFRIGMPEVTWDVWEGHFSIGSFWSQFEIQYPFQAPGINTDSDQQRSVDLTVGGSFQIEGVDFNVKASSKNDFTVFAEMDEGNTIPLGNILNSFGSNIDNPGDLNIDLFRVAVSPGNSFNLAMGMNEQGQGWGLDIGPQEFKVSDVYVNLSKAKGQDASASLGGVLTLGDLGKIDIDYESPGDISIVSFFDQVNLGELIETLVGNVIDLPDGFGFDLEDVSVIIQKENNSYKFQIATLIDGVGNLALIVNKVNGQWGVAFGIETFMDKLSDLPGLSSLSVLDDLGAPDSILVIVSNIERPDFKFPSLSQFNNPELDSNQIPVPASNGLTDGLNLYASWNFGNGDQGINTLLNLLGLSGALDVTVSVPKDPTNGSRLYMSWDGKILSKYDLDAQFGLQLTQGRPELFLGGSMIVPIQGENCIFDVAMSVLTTGVYFSGSMQGTIDFESFQLSNLGLMFGYNWALIPSLGVMCTIDTAAFRSSIALMFDSGDPSRSVMAGAISDITLKGVAEEIAKAPGVPEELTDVLGTISLEGVNEFDLPLSLATSLDAKDQATVAQVINSTVNIGLSSDSSNLLIVVNKEGEKWSLTDIRDNMKHYEVEVKDNKIVCQANAQLYLAPQGIALGGFIFNQGFRVMGALSILGLTWTTDIEISDREGIAATSYLDNDLVILNRDFFRLSDQTGNYGPRFSMATFRRPEQSEEMFRPPHFILDGKLTLLNMTTTAFVKFNSSGFEFLVGQDQDVDFDARVFEGSYDLTWSMGGGIDFNKGITMNGDFDFDLQGKFDIGALLGGNVDMGKVSVGFGIDVDVEAGYDGSNAYLKIKGDFSFGGTEYSFNFNLDANTQGIEKLASEVFREIKEVFTGIYDTAAKWVNEIGNTVEDIGDGISATAQVVGNFFEESPEQVAVFMQDLGADADRIATELVNNGLAAGEQAVADILNTLEFGANEIAGALNSALSTTTQVAGEILQGMNYHVNEIAGALNSAFGTSSQTLGAVLNTLGYNSNQIAGALKSALRLSQTAVADVLNGLGKTATEIGDAIMSSFTAGEATIGKILHDLNFNETEIAGAVKSIYGASANTVTQVIDGLGYGATQLTNALNSAFNYGAQQIGPILDGLGYAADVITRALGDALDATVQEIANVLNSLEKTATQVGAAIQTVFNTSYTQAAQILDHAGYAFTEVGDAMKNVYKQSVTEISKVMNDIGAGLNDITGFINSAYSFIYVRSNLLSFTKTFSGLGFSSENIASSFRQVFSIQGDDMTTYLRFAGKGVEEVTNAIRKAFNVAAETTAKYLRGAGYAVAEVGSALYNVFRTSGEDAAKFLRNAGYAANDIAKALKLDSLWGESSKQVARFLKNAGFGKSTVKSALKAAGWGSKTVDKAIKSIF